MISIPLVGSSNIIIFPPLSKANPMHNFLFCPPDNELQILDSSLIKSSLVINSCISSKFLGIPFKSKYQVINMR